MAIFLAIDLGTTGLKVSLIEDSGKVLDSNYREYPIFSPEPGYAEQVPKLWWSGFINCCQSLKQECEDEFSKVIGIGICGQMHTHVYLDKNFTIIRPAITWMDQRSSKIVKEINENKEYKTLIYNKTKNFATTTYTAPQVKWVKENQPDLWPKVKHILIAKDYLKFKLTGRMVTDYSDASGTLLFDVKKCTWSDEMFRFFGFPKHLFPEALPSNEIIGTVSNEASQLTGIKMGTPVVNGSSDNSAAALGAGMVKPGQVTLIIGTAGVISVCTEKPFSDPQNRTLCWNYCLRNKWVTLGITQTAGESLNWFKNAFDKRNNNDNKVINIFAEYDQLIKNIPDGSDGLIFLPYLNGERTPYWDSFAKGVFYGINLFSAKAHFIKAVMEGVSYALRNNLETVESLGIKVKEIRAVGGGSKSNEWLNILGKVLKKPIYTLKMPDTGLIGNMLLCGKALGLYRSIEETVNKIVKFEKEIHYQDMHEVYEKQYSIFLSVYDNLKKTFKKSAN